LTGGGSIARLGYFIDSSSAMKHLAGTNTYRSHLLHIESLAQSETDVEFGYVESERLLLVLCQILILGSSFRFDL